MMKRHLLKILACASLGAFVAAGPAWAQDTAAEEKTYQPTVGQVGKDVVWVPTSQDLVDIMLDMAELQPDDKLVDLGAGDGRTVISAAKRGITARGIEYNPDLVAMAQSAARQENVADRVSFEQADIFESDFSDATVVTLFLLPKLNMRLRPTLLDMPPGTRVVSNSFLMEDWEPDDTRMASEDCSGHCIAYKWVVPAKVAGDWQLNDKRLVLDQKFQKLEGQVQEGDQATPLEEARVHGKNVAFNVNGQRYEGEIDGDKMRGTIDGNQSWEATKLK
ncbi:SAM-dependent methyltransferase [Pusillimonas sp.]|uniref:SAM-dependent methyltransferase n=1 Tax=Pusillimonas sp. TaxID=3040095 RepID=UPI0037CB2550